MRCRAWSPARRAARDFLDDGASLKAAGVAFYTLIALVPAFTLLVGGASFIVGRAAAQPAVVAKLAALFGAPAATAAARVFELLGPRDSMRLGLVSAAISAYGATRVVVHVQRATAEIWRAHAATPPSPRGWRAAVRRQLVALAILAGLATMLVGSTLLDAALNVSWRATADSMPRWPVWTTETVVALATLTVVHATAYRMLPENPVPWRAAMPAAFAVSLAFVATKSALCYYIGHRALQSASAALGAVLVVMLWIDGYAMLFFAGVELTQVLSRRGQLSTHGARAAGQVQAGADASERSTAVISARPSRRGR